MQQWRSVRLTQIGKYTTGRHYIERQVKSELSWDPGSPISPEKARLLADLLAETRQRFNAIPLFKAVPMMTTLQKEIGESLKFIRGFDPFLKKAGTPTD
jgi:hypothetical protein